MAGTTCPSDKPRAGRDVTLRRNAHFPPAQELLGVAKPLLGAQKIWAGRTRWSLRGGNPRRQGHAGTSCASRDLAEAIEGSHDKLVLVRTTKGRSLASLAAFERELPRAGRSRQARRNTGIPAGVKSNPQHMAKLYGNRQTLLDPCEYSLE